MTVSHVARLHGVNANQFGTGRRQYQNGSLTSVSAGEEVVPAFERTAAMKQIKERQRLLGKKTMEVELLNETVEVRSHNNMDSARALAARGYGLTLHQPLPSRVACAVVPPSAPPRRLAGQPPPAKSRRLRACSPDSEAHR